MSDLTALRKKLIEEGTALLADTPAEQKLDVFKAVTTLYLGLAGKPKQSADAEQQAATFAAMKAKAMTASRVNGDA